LVLITLIIHDARFAKHSKLPLLAA
jgi:hypothetical protein